MDSAVRFLSRNEIDQLCRSEGFYPPVADFDHTGIPENLNLLIPYVEIWGHEFDDVRIPILESTPPKILRHLWDLRLKTDLHKLLNEWLAGPAADRPPYSSAYLAFSGLNRTLSELD